MQLVALEYLLKIEGADQICWSAPFCGEVFFHCFALCRGGALLRLRVLISSEQRAEQSPAPTERTVQGFPYEGEAVAARRRMRWGQGGPTAAQKRGGLAAVPLG